MHARGAVGACWYIFLRVCAGFSKGIDAGHLDFYVRKTNNEGDYTRTRAITRARDLGWYRRLTRRKQNETMTTKAVIRAVDVCSFLLLLLVLVLLSGRPGARGADYGARRLPLLK